VRDAAMCSGLGSVAQRLEVNGLGSVVLVYAETYKSFIVRKGN